MPQERLRRFLHLGQHHGRDFFRREAAAFSIGAGADLDGRFAGAIGDAERKQFGVGLNVRIGEFTTD